MAFYTILKQVGLWAGSYIVAKIGQEVGMKSYEIMDFYWEQYKNEKEQILMKEEELHKKQKENKEKKVEENTTTAPPKKKRNRIKTIRVDGVLYKYINDWNSVGEVELEELKPSDANENNKIKIKKENGVLYMYVHSWSADND